MAMRMASSKSAKLEFDVTSQSKTGTAQMPLPVEIDNSKPMWSQVGKLGDAYWEWVHVAESGCSRFFESDALELLSRTSWWMVPLIFVPAILGVLGEAYFTTKSTADLITGFLIGLVLWQVNEYSFHRFIFHREVSQPFWISLHYVFHGSHHKYPMDKSRCVFAPVITIPMGILYFLLLDMMLPKGLSRGVWAGMGVGYVGYDMIHYILHVNHNLPVKFLKMLQSRHNMHHYKCIDHSYGVSSEILDIIFGT